MHAERDRAPRDLRADLAEADDAERLAGHFDALESTALPPTRLDGPIGGRNLPRQRQEHGERVLRRRDGVGARRMQQRIAESIGAKDAAIFDAHLLVVEDRTLIDEVLRKLKTDLCNVEWAFQEVATRYAETLSKIDDPYLRERALDIQDVTKRVIRNLQGKAPKAFLSLSQPHILVAHNLTPSDTASMSRDNVLGVATDVGSRTSHARFYRVLSIFRRY